MVGQSTIKVVTGLEWMMREVLKGVANLAVDVSEATGVAADWEEWTDQVPSRKRSDKEEKFLHRMLLELDKEARRGEVMNEKRVARARRKMGVGSSQPSITSQLKRMPGVSVSGITSRIKFSMAEEPTQPLGPRNSRIFRHQHARREGDRREGGQNSF